MLQLETELPVPHGAPEVGDDDSAPIVLFAAIFHSIHSKFN